MGDNPPSADDTKVCPYCGETIKKAAIVCRYCGRDLAPARAVQPVVTPAVYVEQKKGGGCGRIAVAIIVLGLAALACAWWVLPNPGSASRSRTSTAPATPTMTAAQLQQAALPIPWDMLARNTENYVGKLMSANGTVVQVLESGSQAQLRVILDGDYDKVVLVRYPGYSKARVLENDKVKLIAQVNGRVDMETVLGKDITLPDLTAQWLEVVKE